MEAQNFRTIETGALTLNIYHATETSFGVASVLVTGRQEAILIDAQFTLADAEQVAQKIKQTGKKLTTIYVSHGDPDFYFGLEVFKRHFPEAVIYATPTVVDHIKATAQKKLDVWGERLGKALTTNVVLPQVLKGNTLTLEGSTLEIVGLNEFPNRSFVWIASAKAVVGGINVFGNSFNLWMADSATPELRKQWLGVLEKISSLNPSIVIPAHASASDALTQDAVNHSKEYLVFYEQALKSNKTSDALIKAVKAKYPTLSLEIALQLGAMVSTGEMKW